MFEDGGRDYLLRLDAARRASMSARRAFYLGSFFRRLSCQQFRDSGLGIRNQGVGCFTRPS